MPGKFTHASVGGQNTAPQLTTSSSTAWTLLRITRYFTIFWPILIILAGSNIVIGSAVVPRTATARHGPRTLPVPSVEQNVQDRTSLIRDNLPAYLDFVGTEVLPVMSKNIDKILQDLDGLTDIKPGLFYHGHIDYSIYLSGGIEELMDMNHLVLQYHTLENPLIFIPYWRQELRNLQDQNVNAWLDKLHQYDRVISTPGAVSGVQYAPLTEDEAVHIAASWDNYRRQNGLASPGLEMLTNMVYLIGGGQQTFYQEAFKNIYRFHGIAFSLEGYRQLDHRTHLENTFSPFQINFERLGKCQTLLPVFEAARAAEYGYILNLNNIYAARQPGFLQDPEMTKLNARLNDILSVLPDDNQIKISTAPGHQWMALFAIGNYIFSIQGSLDSPSIFY